MSDKLVDALIADMKNYRVFRNAWDQINDDDPEDGQDAIDIRDHWIELLDDLGVYDDNGMNEARKSGHRDGRDEELAAILGWIDASEWENTAEANVALDIATAIRNGLHRVPK